MVNQKLIIVRGYPASGKTTIGRLLAKKDMGTFIDHNEILNFLANIVGDDTGIYEEIHNLESAMVKKLLTDKKSVIVARGFSMPDSIKPYLDIAAEAGVEVHIIRLQVSDSNLRLRVNAEERKKGFNPITSEDALSVWVAESPLTTVEGEHKVDADRPIDSVLNQVVSSIDSRPAG